MDINSKIFLAGHKGMVGSSILRLLYREGFSNLILRTSSELDLRNCTAVDSFFKTEKPEYVILAAARVGGINANIKNPGAFLYDNLAIQNNVIHLSHLHEVKKICFLGSSCIYPRECPQPMKEEYLLRGALEPTNEGYALAKIAGLKMIEFYNEQYGLNGISAMPCNIYGTNDSFDPEKSHVLSALVKKVVDARFSCSPEIQCWGTGSAKREFIHVDDVADAILYLMRNYESSEFINVGWGKDISIFELAHLIADLAGYKGKITWDPDKPDGMPRKCLDVSKLTELGYKPKIDLITGIKKTIQEYTQNYI